MIRFQALGTRFTLPLLSLLAPMLCVRLGMRMNMTALILSVSIHEFSHILAAKCMRVSITEIRLTPFGGSTRMENPYGVPPLRLLVTTVAGPLSNLLLAIAFAAMAHWGLILPQTASAYTTINLTLFFFNLLPALPLDGGRILYCLLQLFMPQATALKIGIFSGKMLSALLVLFSLYAFIRSGRLNICLILVSVFIFASARDEQSALWEAKVQRLSEPKNAVMPVRLYQMDMHSDVMQALRLMRPGESAWFILTEKGKPAGLTDSGSLISHFRNGGSADITLDKLAFIQFSDITQERISSISFSSSSDSPGASNALRFSSI